MLRQSANAYDAAVQGLSDAALESPIAFVREVFGDDVFEGVPSRYCGQRVYIPHDPLPDSPICEIMTLEQAKRLGFIHGGAELAVPSGRANRIYRAIFERLRDGKRPAQIAAELECSRSHVFRTKKDLIARGKL